MSRCFPFPSPGYYRNGAAHDALIESIKLQKETDKTKADRKKEKKAKKEKKERKKIEKRNKEKSHKSTIDDTCKDTKTVTELFEKSDLTQEHGDPISLHQPSYSSDSTQNSSKRKRDDYSLLPPDNSTGHGSFKIRVLNKPKASDSNNFVTDVRSNSHQSIPSSSNSNQNLVSSVGHDVGPSTSGRENRTQTKISDSNELCFGRIQQQVVPSIRLGQEGPSSYVSKNIVLHNVTPNRVSSETGTLVAGKRPINEVSVGPSKQTEEPKKADLTRTEKKMIKKHVKYEKLVGRWLPPVLQASFSDVGDDDWLSKGKAVKSSICRGEAETCRESVAPWQPCALFLAEADIHALPYTVPF